MAEAKPKRAPAKTSATKAKAKTPAARKTAPRARPAAKATAKPRKTDTAASTAAGPTPPLSPLSPLPSAAPPSPLPPVEPAVPSPSPTAGGWQAAPEAPFPSLSPPSRGFSALPPVATHRVRGLALPLIALVAAHVVVSAVETALSTSMDGLSPALTIVGLVGNAVSIAAIVVFCIWLFRVLANVEAQQPLSGVHPGWAVGSFFVPFVQLVAPYFEVRRGWLKQVSTTAGLVTAWFVPWSVSLAIQYVTVFVTVGAAFREGLQAAQDGAEAATPARPEWLWIPMAVSIALQAVSAVFLTMMVRRWSALQDPARPPGETSPVS